MLCAELSAAVRTAAASEVARNENLAVRLDFAIAPASMDGRHFVVTREVLRFCESLDMVNGLSIQTAEFVGGPHHIDVVDRSNRGGWVHRRDFDATMLSGSGRSSKPWQLRAS